MSSIGVNPPKTPVTEGSSDMAPATLPNVCKMPGPPAPFIPTPLPNIGQSSDRLTDATTTVKFEGNKVAIKGSYYMSQPSPDVASQGTGGGIVSSTVQGKTEFVAPGSMTVKAEGKNIQLLGDAMTNNGGSPANSATMPGNQQAPAPPEPPMLDCGECGSYSKLQKKRAKPTYERDHVPSKAALKQAAIDRCKPKVLSDSEKECLGSKTEARGITIAIPRASHRGFSPTCGSKNTPTQIQNDAKDLNKARDRDLAAMQAHLDATDPECAAAYKEAAKKVKEHDNDGMIDKAIAECTGD
jgi:uncharacterized Zn-binding protein involved in type VI secretion